MNLAMKHSDIVIQELWRVKDDAFTAADQDAKQFVNMLRLRSADLRNGLRDASVRRFRLAAKAPPS